MIKNVVVDIDGTISIIKERKICLEKNDWNTFFDRVDEDEPNSAIIEIIKNLSIQYNITFCTGRPSTVRQKTIDWLNRYYHCGYINLLMRSADDYRSDILVKPELLSIANITVENTLCIFDDRDCVVKMWRNLGFVCLQVAEGTY